MFGVIITGLLILTFALSGILKDAHTIPADIPLYIISLNLIAFLFNDYLRKIFFGLGEKRKALITDIISYGTQLLGLFIIQMLKLFTLENVLIIIFLSNFISGIYGIINLKEISFKNITISSVFSHYFKKGKWLLGTAVLQWFSGNWFVIAAGSLLGNSAVGAVRIMQNILGVTHVIFLSLENTVPVSASRFFHVDGIKGMMKYVFKMSAYTAAIIFPVLLMLFFAAEPIIKLLYGDQYISQSGLMKPFAIMYVLVFLGTFLRFIIRTVEKTRIIFISYILTSAFSITCSTYMINQFGTYGIVYGLMGAQIITLFCFLISLKGEIKSLLNAG
jgi:O-antigen/teichoic acid export membrane protein